jgi:glucose 1-dehydrogenase
MKIAEPTRQLLAGQKALVTGVDSGIGRAVANALGQAGADVVVTQREGAHPAAGTSGRPHS